MSEVTTNPISCNGSLDLGANLQKNGNVTFKVWAPFQLVLFVNILGKEIYPMHRDEKGYFTLTLQHFSKGDLYFYLLENGKMYPDPVSRALPRGVHGPTEIRNNEFEWDELDWKGIALRDCIFYEIHVGTFTKKGTFDGVVEKLPYLKKLGVNCIEIMPIAEFPGRWNWGYDGVSLYAPSLQYGGIEGFKRLINACHKEQIAVCLDIVYNHLGPEGNYLEQYGPYFSNFYQTPWGKAFNYDGADSGPVRDFVIKNALYWVSEYRIDILRLDAIHGIYDFSAISMLETLREKIKILEDDENRHIHVIAESGLNDARVVKSQNLGGWNFSAVWNDDFHHALHVALTDEKTTYFQDFVGIGDIATALTKTYVYSGKYSSFRKKHHGNSAEGIPFEKFIVFSQNHDQIGNRPLGERLSSLISKKRLKLVPFFTLMSPFIPLIFMGEEYGEKAPFEYFVDYDNDALMKSIFEGRKREFHREDMPFPGRESFQNSCLTWSQDEELLNLYCDLIALRKKYGPKADLSSEGIVSYYSQEDEWLAWEYVSKKAQWVGIFCNLKKEKEFLTVELPFIHATAGHVIYTSEKIERDGKKWIIPSESALIIT